MVGVGDLRGGGKDEESGRTVSILRSGREWERKEDRYMSRRNDNDDDDDDDEEIQEKQPDREEPSERGKVNSEVYDNQLASGVRAFIAHQRMAVLR